MALWVQLGKLGQRVAPVSMVLREQTAMMGPLAQPEVPETLVRRE
jgi:hypothetical protein